MIEKLKNIFWLIANIIKSRWVIIFLASIMISILIWLKGFLFTEVFLRLPLYIVLIIGAFAFYPIIKFIHFIFFKRDLEMIAYGGLSWKPSRFKFRYPEPKCPHCGSNIRYSVIRKPYILARNLSDIENVHDKSTRYEYECPNHGVLNVQNKPMDHMQELAKNKIDIAA